MNNLRSNWLKTWTKIELKNIKTEIENLEQFKQANLILKKFHIKTCS
jgi:hypothetical protein